MMASHSPSSSSSSTVSRGGLSPRSVLGVLNRVGPSHVYPSPSSNCSPPSSPPPCGTVAVGVGFPSSMDAADKENVAPIFDSNLHHRSSLTSSAVPTTAEDEDRVEEEEEEEEEDVFAAIERMRRAREGSVEAEADERKREGEEEAAAGAAAAWPSIPFDPFESSTHSDEEDRQRRLLPQSSSSSTSTSSLLPSNAAADTHLVQTLSLADAEPKPLLSRATVTISSIAGQPETSPSMAIRTTATSAPSPLPHPMSSSTSSSSSFHPRPSAVEVVGSASPTPSSLSSIDWVSADKDLGPSTSEPLTRPSAAKKKGKAVAGSASTRVISTFFSTKSSAFPPPPPPAFTSSTSAVTSADPLPQPPSTYTPSVLPVRPPNRSTLSSLSNFFSVPSSASKKRRLEEEVGVQEQKRRSPSPSPITRKDEGGATRVEREVEVCAQQLPAPKETEVAQKEVSTPAAEFAAAFASARPSRAATLFTTEEDEDEDNFTGGDAGDDIEAQLMGEDDGGGGAAADEPADTQLPLDEETEAQVTATAQAAEMEVGTIETDNGEEGEGEDEEGVGGDEGGNEEEQLAAALLEEEASDDDSEERRRRARNLPSALTATLSPSHRSTDSDDSDDSDGEDWEALQAEDERKRQARLDALHATTERLMGSSASAADSLKALTSPVAPVVEVVNPVYEKLLARMKEKEKIMGAEVEVRSVRESLEEDKRRMRMERESREREREREDSQPLFVEKEVNGEKMMEINLDALEAAGEDDEEDDDDKEEEEEDDNSESPVPLPSSTVVGGSPSTHVLRATPLSAVVAQGLEQSDVALSSPSSSTPRLSEVSTDDDFNSAARAPSSSSPTPPSSSSSPGPQMEDMVDLIDDDMDEETKRMIRAAQDRVRKRRLLTREDDRPLKHSRTESLPLSENALIDSAQAAPILPTAQPHLHSTTSHVSLDSSMRPPAPRVAEVEMRRVTKSPRVRSSPLIDAEAEDEDVVEGKRSTSPNESDEADGADEYEEDGFLTKDTVDSNSTTAQQCRSTHTELDAVKDAEEVEALHAKFVTRTASKIDRPPIQRAVTGGVQRRGSQGSAPSASPVKAASPVPLATVVRSGSGLHEVDLLDDDRRLSDGEEEEEVDDNSSARQHKRALLQHRARMLKRQATSSPSPTSSPLKSLSRFDLIDDTSLPPLPSPLHPPTRNTTMKGILPPPHPPDFSSLHSQIARQSGLGRRGSFNSFLGDSGGWKGVGAVRGVVAVQVKAVSLSKSYIFRRVSDEMNENCHKGSEGGGKGEGKEGGKSGKGKGKAEAKKEVEKRPVQGAAFLSSLARSKSTVISHAGSMLKRQSSTLMSAMLRAVSDE